MTVRTVRMRSAAIPLRGSYTLSSPPPPKEASSAADAQSDSWHWAESALMPSAYAAGSALMASACRPGSSGGLLRWRVNRNGLPRAPSPASARGLQRVPPRGDPLRENYLEEPSSRQEVGARTLFGPAGRHDSRLSYAFLSMVSCHHGVPDRRSSSQRNTFAIHRK